MGLTAHLEQLVESARNLDFEIAITVAQIDEPRKDADVVSAGVAAIPPLARRDGVRRYAITA